MPCGALACSRPVARGLLCLAECVRKGGVVGPPTHPCLPPPPPPPLHSQEAIKSTYSSVMSAVGSTVKALDLNSVRCACKGFARRLRRTSPRPAPPPPTLCGAGGGASL